MGTAPFDEDGFLRIGTIGPRTANKRRLIRIERLVAIMTSIEKR
jgi:hypothetical protein